VTSVPDRPQGATVPAGCGVRRVVTPPPCHRPDHRDPATLAAWVAGRFPAHAARMLAEGRCRHDDGTPVGPAEPYRPRTALWIVRDLPAEPHVPGALHVVHRDERLVVVDKPPFLATIPRGSHVRETLVARLRDELGLPELQPVHRLDRLTSGLVVCTTERRWRGAYQMLFQRRDVRKRYLALVLAADAAAAPADAARDRLRTRLLAGEEIEVCSRIRKRHGVWQAEEVPGDPNAITRMRRVDRPDAVPAHGRSADATGADAAAEALSSGRSASMLTGSAEDTAVDGLPGVASTAGRALIALEPHTGRTHQLRVHLASLGLPIAGDPLYPTVREAWPGGPPADDPAHPLQLLAVAVALRDPVDGRLRRFTARRTLPVAPAQPRAGL
jgi:tRNA pseudouridine32 synthase/23S rRNA pseudouridine746 synthase